MASFVFLRMFIVAKGCLLRMGEISNFLENFAGLFHIWETFF